MAWTARVGPDAPLIPFDNYKYLEKLSECTHYKNMDVCLACGKKLDGNDNAVETENEGRK